MTDVREFANRVTSMQTALGMLGIDEDGLTAVLNDDQEWRKYQVNLPVGSRVGAVEIVQFEVDEATALGSIMRAALNDGRGRVWPGVYTGLTLDGDLWMSDTPDEIDDHMPMIHEAEKRGGRVLVNGLGLGMVIKALLDLPQVEHVDVVELNKDVIDLVGPHYASERCTIHHANAFEVKWPEGAHWTAVWSDIWLPISPDNLPEIARLKAKYADMADWHGLWSEDLIYSRWPELA